MRHRCPAPLTLVAAALALVLGVRPVATYADAMAIPAITNWTATTASPTPPVQDFQVFLDVSSSNGIVPPAGNGDPLTVLNTSSGLDVGQVYNGLQNNQNSSGQTTSQVLGLAFGQGLSANGSLQFTLDVNGSLATPPQLSFDSSSPYGSSSGLEIINPTTFTTNTSSGATATYTLEAMPQATPEPLSLWLWVVISIAALLNVRRMRRNQVVLARV